MAVINSAGAWHDETEEARLLFRSLQPQQVLWWLFAGKEGLKSIMEASMNHNFGDPFLHSLVATSKFQAPSLAFRSWAVMGITEGLRDLYKAWFYGDMLRNSDLDL